MDPKKIVSLGFVVIGFGIIVSGSVQSILSAAYAAGRTVIFIGIFIFATAGFYFYKFTHDLQFKFKNIRLFLIITTFIWGILCLIAGIWDLIWGNHIDEGAKYLFSGVSQLFVLMYLVGFNSKFPSFNTPTDQQIQRI